MTSKLLTALTALVILCGTAGAQQDVSLNGVWEFRLARNEKEAEALSGFYRSDFKARGFDRIEVPSNWAVLGYEEPVYRGFKEDRASEGYYRLNFRTPEGFSGKRLLLNFDGVWSEAEVWLNGELLGTHVGGYTGFSFTITDRLKEDGDDNILAVKVIQTGRDYKFDTFDDWTLGGIYRDVSISATPRKRWIEYVTAVTDLDFYNEDAELEVRAMIGDTHKNTLPGNYPSPGEPYSLRMTLSDAEGHIVQTRTLEVPAHTSTSRELKQSFHLTQPEKWTAETPYLYTLKVELVEKDGVSQVWQDKIGIREISTDGGVFRINGQTVKLRGVNRHDEYPDVGRATRREHWLKDIKMMKDANINYIRCSHYTPAEGFIRLCDSLGMYVSNEVSLGGSGDLMYDPSYMSSTLIRTDETVRRDINRASIVVWSVGNEDPLTPQHLAAIKYIKALDPTRPVLIPWRHEGWLPEEIDMLSVHYWKPAEYDSIAGNSSRPIISTEYTHAYGNEGMGGLDERWKALTRHPSGAGAAIWMWADQGLWTPTARPSGYTDSFSSDPHLRIDGQGWDGIVDSWRNPTGDYWETKAVYAPVYPLVETATFTPGEQEVTVPIQNDYDFTDLSEVSIYWEIFEEGKSLGCGEDRINGAPHSAHLFRLPVSAVSAGTDPSRSHYAHLTFLDSEGREITRRSIELVPATIPMRTYAPVKLALDKGKTITVTAGRNEYFFDPGTGELCGISANGKMLAEGLSPTLWRPLDQCEVTAFSKPDRRYAHNLNGAVPEVRSLETKTAGSSVIITASVRYRVAEDEYFDTEYRYTVSDDGSLAVHYEILAHLGISQLPIVGMNLATTGPESIKWLGLGEADAWPYRDSAPIFGYWGGSADSVYGNKAMRRIDLGFGNETLSASGTGYFWRDRERPESVSLLSEVFARPEKGRQAGEEMPALRTDTGKPFCGDIIFSTAATIEEH